MGIPMTPRRGSGSRWRWLLIGVAMCSPLVMSSFGQESRAGAPPARVVPPEIMAATATGDAAQIVALERKFEEATVKGDAATVATIIAKTFSFTHGNGWATIEPA